jgi:hypothetical protein
VKVTKKGPNAKCERACDADFVCMGGLHCSCLFSPTRDQLLTRRITCERRPRHAPLSNPLVVICGTIPIIQPRNHYYPYNKSISGFPHRCMVRLLVTTTMAVHVFQLAIVGALLACVYQFIVYPALLSPLAKIPCAHWSCRFSSIWIYWMRWSKGENAAVYKRHMKSGSVIRLAPNLLSVNCFEDGLKTIYQGGFPKPPFYINGFTTYGYV